MMPKQSRPPHEVIPHPSLRRLSHEQICEQLLAEARTTMTEPTRNPLDVYGRLFGLDLIREDTYREGLPARSFTEILTHTAGHIHVLHAVALTIRLNLKQAEKSLHKRPTQKALAAAEALRRDMAKLKNRLEQTLQFVNDWSESDVAMLGRGKEGRDA